jgi:hypothetical protein
VGGGVRLRARVGYGSARRAPGGAVIELIEAPLAVPPQGAQDEHGHTDGAAMVSRIGIASDDPVHPSEITAGPI